MKGRRELGSLLAVIFVATALRLAVILLLPDAEPDGDQPAYLNGAGQIASGGVYQGTRGPGYPAFLALGLEMGAKSPVELRLGNVLLGVLSVVGVWSLGRELFGRRVGLAASAILALHPRWVGFPLYFFSENLAAASMIWAIALACRAQRTAGLASSAAAGALFALAALTRESLLYFVPLVAIAQLLLSRAPRRRALASAAVLLVTVVLLVTTWTVRNYRVHDRFIPVAFSSGIPLFEGNLEAPSERIMRARRKVLIAQFYASEKGSWLAVDEQFRHEAWQIIRDRQPTWIFEKLVTNGPLLFQPDITWPHFWEFADAPNREALRGVYTWLFLPLHGMILVAGALGLAHFGLRGREMLPVLFLGFSIAVHVVANAGLSRFQLLYEWVLVLATAVLIVRGLPGSWRARILAVGLVTAVTVSQVVAPERWHAPVRCGDGLSPALAEEGIAACPYEWRPRTARGRAQRQASEGHRR